MADTTPQFAVRDGAARKLSNATKTPVQMPAITPRWLTALIPWKPLEAGVLRVNRVKSDAPVEVTCGLNEDNVAPNGYIDYEEDPREYTLNAISTVVNVNTHIADLFSSPHDQVREQLRLTIESVKERQESELLNNFDYGLLNQAVPSQRLSTRKGPPTPDDLDELISKVWKEPAFFVAHPRTIAAFGRECTRRGVPPAIATLFGSQFLTWRGLPLVPSDKVPLEGGKSSILLLRVGESKQGVVGLFQPGLSGEQSPGLSVRFMGIDNNAVASYLVSLYCSAALLVPDALAILENVDTGFYHEYK
ncbi:MAG: family 2A encapsulin nanocompartment shell protein [Polyangiales bacterium]